jgi:predicted RecA/RadA family phage recombinase
MKRLFGKYTLVSIMTVALLVICAGLSMAGVIHPAVGALPFIGAIKVRDSLDRLRTLKYTHSAATVTDTIYLLNGRVMLAMNSMAANLSNIFVIGGLIEYASETGVAWTAGDALYWDDAGKKFTKTSAGNTKCAIASEDKASAAATGMVLLIPTP